MPTGLKLVTKTTVLTLLLLLSVSATEHAAKGLKKDRKGGAPLTKGSSKGGGRGPSCKACSGCSCYQGPAGPSGQDGHPGGRGVQGVQGIQGVQGVEGSEGPAGPKGHQGSKGQKGRRGFKGRKGEAGHVRLVPVPTQKSRDHVAFSVTMDTELPQTSDYRVLHFDIILTNIGDGYDVTTGEFTSPVNGTYMVGFGGVSYHGQNILLHLVRNGQRLLSAFDNSGCYCCPEEAQPWGSQAECAGAASNVGILTLLEGDRVWIELPHEYGMHNALYHNYATFYGFLIFPSGPAAAASPPEPTPAADRGATRIKGDNG